MAENEEEVRKEEGTYCEECEEDGGGSETVKTVVDEGVDRGMGELEVDNLPKDIFEDPSLFWGEFNKLIRKPDFLIFQVVPQARFSWTLPPMHSAV